VKQIKILCGLEGMDSENANVDICVTTEDGFSFNLTCITTKNIQFLMDKEEMDYAIPGYPCIISKADNEKNIEKAIQAYISKENGYWLELYYFAADIDRTVFEQLRAESIQKEKEFVEFQKLDDLISECKKLINSVEELIKFKEDE
jgi:ABC-type Fe3+ transport system substrate-binding protein